MARPVTLLVPVKDGAATKTRLEVGADRRELMRAFARDAVAAARESSLADVVVVGDPSLADLGVPVLPDAGAGDLNAALRSAAAGLPAGGPVAVMLADLPCLRSSELDEGLAAALRHGGRCFVADSAGTGTTLLVAASGDLDPRFGVDSARRHLESGAHALTDPLPTLRQDVDTAEDLERALLLGVGPATTALLASH